MAASSWSFNKRAYSIGRPNIMNNSTCSDQGSFYPLCLNSESKPFTFRIQKPSPTLVSAGSTTLISCAGFALASSMFESRPLYCEEKKKKEKKTGRGVCVNTTDDPDIQAVPRGGSCLLRYNGSESSQHCTAVQSLVFEISLSPRFDH